MKYKIIDNFLKKEEFSTLENVLLGNNFPWYLNEVLNKKVEEEFQFTHTFYDNFVIKSDYVKFRLESWHMGQRK